MGTLPDLNMKYRPRLPIAEFIQKLADKDAGVFKTQAQAFIASFMLGVLNNERLPLDSSESTKAGFDFTNFDSHELDVLKAVAILKCENDSDDELIKCIEEYVNGGLPILKKNYENYDGRISLRDLFD